MLHSINATLPFARLKDNLTFVAVLKQGCEKQISFSHFLLESKAQAPTLHAICTEFPFSYLREPRPQQARKEY